MTTTPGARDRSSPTRSCRRQQRRRSLRERHVSRSGHPDRDTRLDLAHDPRFLDPQSLDADVAGGDASLGEREARRCLLEDACDEFDDAGGHRAGDTQRIVAVDAGDARARPVLGSLRRLSTLLSACQIGITVTTLALVLAFIGIKMMLIDIFKIPTPISLGVVAVIIAATVVLSLKNPPKEGGHA